MGRAYDPARATRERLIILERREKARAQARAVAAGVSETVALDRHRGAAFEKPEPRRGERETAYRRMTGLEWLLRKGRISECQAAAGERYGACYRRAGQGAPIGSTLEVQPGMGNPSGPPLSLILKQAQGRLEAEETLARYRAQLLAQRELVSACDLCCGREMTPREAAGGERDGARLEAVLKVALDILAMAAG